jgi:hypothetical protein
MNRLTATSLLASTIALGACQTDKHTMVDATPGTTAVCTKCYNKIEDVRRTYRGSGQSHDETITTFACPDCKTQMTVYSENGAMMVRCPTCAPRGVPCDKCVPAVSR